MQNQSIHGMPNIYCKHIADLSSQYESCKDMLLKNSKLKGKDGVYEIHVGDGKKEVFCDMTTDEGGWTVSSYTTL